MDKKTIKNNIKCLLVNRQKSVKWLNSQFEGERGLVGIPKQHLNGRVKITDADLETYSVIFSLPNRWDWQAEHSDYNWVERYPNIDSRWFFRRNILALMESRELTTARLAKQVRNLFGSHSIRDVNRHLGVYASVPSLIHAYFYAVIFEVRVADLASKDLSVDICKKRETYLQKDEILPTFYQKFNEFCWNENVEITKPQLLTGVKLSENIGPTFSLDSALKIANYFGVGIDFFV